MVKSKGAYSGPTGTRAGHEPGQGLRRLGTLLGGLAVLAAGMWAAPAQGQRIQFPTPDATVQPVSATPAIPVQAPAAPTYQPATPVPAMPYPAAPAMAAPALAPAVPASPTYAPAPGVAVPVTPPPATGFGPAPMATLNGTVQPPPTTWDPYAPAGAGPPGAILPQTPYPVMPPGALALPAMPAVVGQAYRFLQGVSLDYHWFAGHGSIDKELGLNEVDVAAHFALPVFYQGQAPLVVSPGFKFNFWDGPKTIPPSFVDLPSKTYDAYLDTAWCPQITPVLGAELDVRVGVYSDFKIGTWDMFRITGKGLGVVNVSPDLQFKLGAAYLNRVNMKLLPSGGFVWMPNPETRFDLMFPNPKFTQRLQNVGYTEWWWYISGDYGGDSWVVQRAAIVDPTELVSYSDMRVALGLEFKRPGGLTGLFETGYAFDRSLTYRLPPASGLNPNFYPTSAFFVRAGLTY